MWTAKKQSLFTLPKTPDTSEQYVDVGKNHWLILVWESLCPSKIAGFVFLMTDFCDSDSYEAWAICKRSPMSCNSLNPWNTADCGAFIAPNMCRGYRALHQISTCFKGRTKQLAGTSSFWYMFTIICAVIEIEIQKNVNVPQISRVCQNQAFGSQLLAPGSCWILTVFPSSFRPRPYQGVCQEESELTCSDQFLYAIMQWFQCLGQDLQIPCQRWSKMVKGFNLLQPRSCCDMVYVNLPHLLGSGLKCHGDHNLQADTCLPSS